MRIIVAVPLALTACGRGPNPSEPAPAASPFAEPAPDAVPLAALNSADPEFGLAYDPVAQVAYFDRTSSDRSRVTIYQAEWYDGAWQTPTIAPWSGTYRDLDAFFHPEFDRIFFSSNRPTSGRDARADFDLWSVARDGDGWDEPRPVGGELNDRRSTGYVSIARDGELYVDATDDSGRAIYMARPTADGYGALTRVALDVPDGVTASNPLIARDRSFLIHVFDPGPHGGADLMVAFRRADDTWGPSTPLIGVNTEHGEFAPALDPSGRVLIFTSERPGVMPAVASGRPPGDLYMIDLAVALPER